MGSDKRERQKENRRQRIEEEADSWRREQRNRRIVWFGGIAVVVLAVVAAINFIGSDDGDEAVSTDGTSDVSDATGDTADDEGETAAGVPGGGASITGETPCPEPDGSSERTTSFENPPPDCLDPDKDYVAVFDTSEGEIRVALDTESTPGTANNFAVLSQYHYYDDTTVFRTDPSIEIIQGGAPHSNDPSDIGPGYTIVDEGGPFSYSPGQLVMARTAAPDSAGAQFFFVAGEGASSLDGQGTYVVFGDVTEGLDVVEGILASHVDDPTNPLGGAPDPTVTINSITIEET